MNEGTANKINCINGNLQKIKVLSNLVYEISSGFDVNIESKDISILIGILNREIKFIEKKVKNIVVSELGI